MTRSLRLALSTAVLLAALPAHRPAFADADYSILKLDAPDPVGPGALLTYTLEVSNEGPDSLADPTVEDVLPAGTAFQSLNAPAGWSCSTPAVGANGAVSCTAGSFDPGTATFTLIVLVDAAQPLGSTLTNTATITSSTVDRGPGDTEATVVTTVLSPASLIATKEVSVTPSGAVTYTLVITNVGAAAQLDNPGGELVDVLPPELVLVSASVPAGAAGTATADLPANAVTWNGVLAAGASVTVTIEAVPAATTAVGQTVTNQGALAFDADGDGNNEATGLTDDPALPERDDPTSFVVLALPPAEPQAVPTLGEVGVALMALLLAMAGAILLRRKRYNTDSFR